MDESSGRKRGRRVSHRQLEELWKILNSHRELAMGYNKTAEAREFSKRMWVSVAETLNSCEDGAIKNSKGWSSYWLDYKSKLKKKVAANQELSEQGHGPSDFPLLNVIETKFLNILVEDRSGLQDVQVYVIPTEPQPSITLEKNSPKSDFSDIDLDAHRQRSPLFEEKPTISPIRTPIPQEELHTQPQISTQSVNSSHRVRRRRHYRPITQETTLHRLMGISRESLTLDRRRNEIWQKILNVLLRLETKVDKIVYA